MNNRIYGYGYMASFHNPAARVLSAKWRVNKQKFLRWAESRISHLTLMSKGRQYKALAFAGAIGTIMQSTCACLTAIMQLTRTQIGTTITEVGEFVLRLSRGYA